MEIIGKYNNKIVIKCIGGHYHTYPIISNGSFFCDHEGTTSFDYLNVNKLVDVTNVNIINWITMNLTDEQLIDIYHIVFNDVHFNGFMVSEVKNLLYDPEYTFLQRPKSVGWHDDVIKYLEDNGFDPTQY